MNFTYITKMERKISDTELAAKAEEVIKLADQMDDIFGDKPQAKRAHLKLAIMAGIVSGYDRGTDEGYVEGANTFDKNRRNELSI